MAAKYFVHPTAIIEDNVEIGDGASIWHFCHVRSGAKIGRNVSIGRDVYVDKDVSIGDFSRVQNGVSIYQGVEIHEYCFIGPHVIFTNDPNPRVLKRNWIPTKTVISAGGSLGAGSIIRCGITIGNFSMIGAGSVVTKDTRAFSLYVGLPSAEKCRICVCGETKYPLGDESNYVAVNDCCQRNLPDEMISFSKKFLS